MKNKKQSKTTVIKDIFNGNLMDIWEDNEFIFISFPYATISFPKENYQEFKQDIEKLAGM